MKLEKGMQPDMNLYSSAEGTWAMGKNIRQVNGAIEVDFGEIDLTSVGGNVVGTCNTGKSLYIVTSEADYEEEGIHILGWDRIYKYSKDTTNPVLIVKADFNLDPTSELSMVYKFNNKSEIVLAWVDGVNLLRVINVDNLPFKGGINAQGYLNYPDQLKLTKVKPGTVFPKSILSVATSGVLNAGIYQIAVRYKYKDVITDWSLLSNRVLILGVSTAQIVEIEQLPDYLTPQSNIVNYLPYLSSEDNNKGLSILLTDLDTSYDTIDIAIIKSISTGGYESTVGVKTNINITSYTSMTVYISGTYDNYITLEEVLDYTTSIIKPKAITNFRDKLLIGSYESIISYDTDTMPLETLDLKWCIKKDDGGNNGKLPTFQWGEVYALYLAYEYIDGTVGQFVHNKGRGLVGTEGDPFIYTPTADMHLQPNCRNFHVTDTSSVDSVTDSLIIGTFGAWENENEFYTGTDNVRHHRFPTKYSTFTNANVVAANWTNEDSKFARLGIKIDISTLQSLPANVKGVILAYAKRDLDNATVQDSGVSIAIPSYIEGLAGGLTRMHYDGGANIHPILINNATAPKYSYFVSVYDNAHNLVNGRNILVGDISFRIEDNTETDNEFRPDMIHTTEGHFAGESTYIMSDLRDIFVPRLSQELILAGNVLEGKSEITYEGDVYSSYFFAVLYFKFGTIGVETLHSEIRRGIITSPIIQDLYEATGLPFYEGMSIDEFEKGVQTLSFNRFQTRLMGLPQLPINKPLLLLNDWSKLISVYNKDIISSYGSTNEYENWIRFDPNSTYTMPSISEYIYELITYGNTLYIRTDRTLYIASIKDTMDMSSGSIGLKSGSLFDQLPQEMLPTDDGYISANSKYATYKSKAGIILVDKDTASIYILGQQMVDITILNKEYFKQLFATVESTHLSSLRGVSSSYDKHHNRLFISIDNKLVTFSMKDNQLVDVKSYGNRALFNLLGTNDMHYIYNKDGVYTIGKFTDTALPDESYIDVAIAMKDGIVFGINSVQWVTRGGVMNTIEAIGIWTELAGTGVIDITRSEWGDDSIDGNTFFNQSGVYAFNDIFDNVRDNTIAFLSGTEYDPAFVPSNILTDGSDDTDMSGYHYKIRFYLRKSDSTATDRTVKLLDIAFEVKQDSGTKEQ